MPPGPKPRDLLDRALDRIDIRGANDCWPGSGYTNKGYPCMMTGSNLDGSRKIQPVFRVVYDYVVGDRAEGEEADHLCRNRLCCNPSHLQAVSRRENILRGTAPPALHAVKTHCPQGHEYAGDNLYMAPRSDRLSDRQCRACRKQQRDQRRARLSQRRTSCNNGS